GILVVSDHGNAEDVTTLVHTTNMVPALLFSESRRDQKLFAERVKNLTDVYHAVLDYFND
ncbi:MAG: hypothetical protein KAR18_06480, partial [Spirochaetes bacterium]|nr:hypothetical protein [Spirochaetota bacterium]